MGYELKSGDAVEPCSECTGGAWGTFKGWNFGEMNSKKEAMVMDEVRSAPAD